MKHDLTLVANVAQTVPAGFYIKVMTATADLDVRLYDQEGRQLVNAEDVSQGDGFNEPSGFGYAEIESTTAQNVVIQVLPVVMESTNLVGDVNALTRFDNLTPDGNRYFAGYSMTGGLAKRGQIAYYNPVGSGITTYIDVLRLNSFGNTVWFYSIDNTNIASFTIGSINVSNKKINGVAGKTLMLLDNTSALFFGVDMNTVIPTDTYGTPTSLDFKNSPIELTEGKGINFISLGTGAGNGLNSFAEMWEE